LMRLRPFISRWKDPLESPATTGDPKVDKTL
jgi:hypothetical protein